MLRYLLQNSYIVIARSPMNLNFNISVLYFVLNLVVYFMFNPFAALLTSYLVMRKLVAVCPYDEYTRHEFNSSNA